ncbi:MAG: hypothetical protein KF851_00475 [Pirellulaceae bacterium]|nr:hypothetical protein [Pirellulaceae bacterium]
MCQEAIDAIKELDKRGAKSFITVVAGLETHEVVCRFRSLREAQLFHRALIQCGKAARVMEAEEQAYSSR